MTVSMAELYKTSMRHSFSIGFVYLNQRGVFLFSQSSRFESVFCIKKLIANSAMTTKPKRFQIMLKY